METDPVDPVVAFVRAACVPLDGWHGAGTLEQAEAIRAAHPEVAGASIHSAAILGDEAAVRGFLARDPASATIKGGAHGWDPLTYLCFSRYLRIDRTRWPAFLRTAQALLDAGADARTGFQSLEHALETALYGAAGVARHPELTRLLLERGADPNDGETAYHAPETLDDSALREVVGSGKLDAEGITTMLHRKLDWHHYDGVAWLLDHRADPNRPNHGFDCSSAIHHALGRCTGLRYFELMLDHGADPTLPPPYDPPAAAIAARMGRADVLDLFQRRGFAYHLDGDDRFLEACARGDEVHARGVLTADPGIVARLQARDPELLAEFAGAGNRAGVSLMLDLGFDITSATGQGGAHDDTALHVAVWRGRAELVRLLVERGAPLEARNAVGETPLGLAVHAMVQQSAFTPHDSTEIVSTLLAAGARVESVRMFPSGSRETDDLLRAHGKSG